MDDGKASDLILTCGGFDIFDQHHCSEFKLLADPHEILLRLMSEIEIEARKLNMKKRGTAAGSDLIP